AGAKRTKIQRQARQVACVLAEPFEVLGNCVIDKVEEVVTCGVSIRGACQRATLTQAAIVAIKNERSCLYCTAEGKPIGECNQGLRFHRLLRTAIGRCVPGALDGAQEEIRLPSLW